MEKNVVLFHQQHQRHPSFEETRNLLSKSGCKKVEKISQKDDGVIFSCSYSGHKILISSVIQKATMQEDENRYFLYFDKGGTGCRTWFGTRKTLKEFGESNGISCWKSDCLNWPGA